LSANFPLYCIVLYCIVDLRHNSRCRLQTDSRQTAADTLPEFKGRYIAVANQSYYIIIIIMIFSRPYLSNGRAYGTVVVCPRRLSVYIASYWKWHTLFQMK